MLEYTNNMVSNFNETILEGLPSRGNHSKITQLLAPDSVLEGDGYRINRPDKTGVLGHLGYEITENGKVIVFTTTSTYLDTTVYEEGYVPRYQIRAYDQRLNATAISDVWQFDAQAAACAHRREELFHAGRGTLLSERK